jgi:hypothetical protein
MVTGTSAGTTGGTPIEPDAGAESAEPGSAAGPRATGDPGLATQTVIEPTTGAPLAAFPQRAPHAHPPSAASPTSGTARAGAPRTRTVSAGAPHPGQSWADPVPAARTGAFGRATPIGAVAQPEAESEAGAAEEEDFWLPIEEVHWDGTPVTPTPRRWWFRRDGTDARTPRRPRGQRHPAAGLAGLLLFALLGSFFAWVGAEPLWLAFGHGERGTATVLGCTGDGLTLRCRGDFTTADGSFTAWNVRLADVEPDRRTAGALAPARMLSTNSPTAYVGSANRTLHLRWSLGLALVLLCGAGIGWATGALRLPGRWTPRAALVAGLAGPLLLSVGFLAVAFRGSGTP